MVGDYFGKINIVHIDRHSKYGMAPTQDCRSRISSDK